MQQANALLALNGNRGNSVPKFNVTPAEVAVLTAIHGGDAVYDIEPLETETTISHREEFARLAEAYPAKDEDGNPILRVVYPGAAPVLHETFDDLQLDPSAYKPVTRAAPKAAVKTGRAKKAPAPVAPKPANDADTLLDEMEAAEDAADGSVLS